MQPLQDPDREAFIVAALEVLKTAGPAGLSLRRVAEVAGISTMGIYSRFGNRAGMLEAVYLRGFDMLRDRLLAAGGGDASALQDLSDAYRAHALENPVLYGLMFERPLPDFEPSPEARADSLAATFSILVEAVGARFHVAGDEAARAAYKYWAALHGLVSIELNHAERAAVPGWILETRADHQDVMHEALRDLVAGWER